MLVSVPAAVTNMNPRADRSWKLVFETRELTGDEVKILADNFQGEGWLLFKPNDYITPDEVPKGEAESGAKTPSARLRAVIYLLWKQKGGGDDPDAFYRTTMEKILDSLKAQLEPNE